jgi:hypothetical protein
MHLSVLPTALLSHSAAEHRRPPLVRDAFVGSTRSALSRSARGAQENPPPPGVPTYLPFLRFFLRFSGLILENIFYGGFGLLMQRNGQKCDKKNRWEKTTGKKFFFLNFFRPRAFDMYFPKKVLNGVFELPLLRNAQKRHKTNLKIKNKNIRGFQFYFSWAPLAQRSLEI